MRSAMVETTFMLCSTVKMVRPAETFLISWVTRSTSSWPMPWVGSSSSISSGSMASVVAISSARLRPYGRLTVTSSAKSSRPTSVNNCIARSSSCDRVRSLRQKWNEVPSLRCRPRRTFSISVRWGNTAEIWNERMTPRRAICAGCSRVMSCPLNRMVPEVGVGKLVSRLKHVVLPVPRWRARRRMDGPSTLTPMASTPTQPSSGAPRSLTGLLPFLRPYRARIALSVVFLVLAALATLAFPLALRNLVDGGLVNPDKGAQTMALRNHFEALFTVAVALGVFSAARFYMVSWLGERVTADLRNAVYGHVLQQSPHCFETTQTGEVLSRLTTDTTLVQTVVGSSLSMGLRNAAMGAGALAMLVWTNPYVMSVVMVAVVLVVLPTMWIGRRVRRLSRDSQDRVSASSAIAAEGLNAVPVVQSYMAEPRERTRFMQDAQNP